MSVICGQGTNCIALVSVHGFKGEARIQSCEDIFVFFQLPGLRSSVEASKHPKYEGLGAALTRVELMLPRQQCPPGYWQFRRS